MTDDHTDTDLTDHHGEAETLRRENERLRGANAAWVINFENVFAEGSRQKSRAENAEADLAHMQGDRNRWMDAAQSARRARDAAHARIADLEAQLAREEKSHEGTITQRDRAESMADKLAHALAGDAIGEHSSANDPWQNALDIAALTPPPDAGLDALVADLHKRADAFGVLLVDPPKPHPSAVAMRSAAAAITAMRANAEVKVKPSQSDQITNENDAGYSIRAALEGGSDARIL